MSGVSSSGLLLALRLELSPHIVIRHHDDCHLSLGFAGVAVLQPGVIAQVTTLILSPTTDLNVFNSGTLDRLYLLVLSCEAATWSTSGRLHSIAAR